MQDSTKNKLYGCYSYFLALLRSTTASATTPPAISSSRGRERFSVRPPMAQTPLTSATAPKTMRVTFLNPDHSETCSLIVCWAEAKSKHQAIYAVK